MRLFVKVKTRAKEEIVTREDETHFTVSVKVSPVDVNANHGLVKILKRSGKRQC